MHSSQGDGSRPEGGGHRRGTGSGTEDDIFSHVVGGLDLEAEQRSSSYGQGKAPCQKAGVLHASRQLWS